MALDGRVGRVDLSRMVRRGEYRAVAAGLLLTLSGCGAGADPAPSPPTIEAVGVATDVRIYPDHVRYEFADGSVHEVADSYRQMGDGGGLGLVVIGFDAEGPFVLTFPTQGGLPPDCYRDNGVGIERGVHIELWGILFAKAPDFVSPVEPDIGSGYPMGTRFCLNSRGLVTSVIGEEVADPVRFDAWTFSSDRRSITVAFTGGPEFDAENPWSKAYRGTAEFHDDELVIGIHPLPFPGQVPEGHVCTAEAHARSLELELAGALFRGTRIRDLAGQLFFLEEPLGLVEITALPDGWVEHAGESLSASPNGRWARVYAPAGRTPLRGYSRGQVELIQAFGAPAEVSGGDLQPNVSINGQDATFYLWEPGGEMVLVWEVSGDGLAMTGNLSDFTRDEFIALAESVVAPR